MTTSFAGAAAAVAKDSSIPTVPSSFSGLKSASTSLLLCKRPQLFRSSAAAQRPSLIRGWSKEREGTVFREDESSENERMSTRFFSSSMKLPTATRRRLTAEMAMA